MTSGKVCKKCDNPLCDTDRECISPSRYKPCPFCESTEVVMGYCSESHRSFFVECESCGAQGPEIPIDSIKQRESGRKKATEAWNIRSKA
ncbi:MAG: hypothetical protein COB12_12015 [Flavobacterium sp.]|nr:MAG: hypothetical protein COB12_12015 [Flavobacterium sp.]